VRPFDHSFAVVNKLSCETLQSLYFTLGNKLSGETPWSLYFAVGNKLSCETLWSFYFTLGNKLSCETLWSLYFTLVNPYYQYANTVWSGGNSIVLKSWLSTQKKAIHIISGKHWKEHTVPLFAKLHIFNLFQIKCKLIVICLKFVIVNYLLTLLICLKLLQTFTCTHISFC